MDSIHENNWSKYQAGKDEESLANKKQNPNTLKKTGNDSSLDYQKNGEMSAGASDVIRRAND